MASRAVTPVLAVLVLVTSGRGEDVPRKRPPTASGLTAKVFGARRPQVALQFPPQPGIGGSIVLADRRMIQRMESARTAIDEKRYSDAIALLQLVLDHGSDAFFQPKDQPETLYRSLRDEATRLIGTIPEKDRDEVYEREYGPEASALLEEAVGSSNTAAIATVARRFLHTKAGAEAQYRLALLQLDQGFVLAAATTFDRLVDLPAARRFEPSLSIRRMAALVAAGQTERAEEVAREFAERNPEVAIRVAGRDLGKVTGDEDIVARLADRLPGRAESRLLGEGWTTVRGGPSRRGFVSFAPDAAAGKWSRSSVIDPFREDPDETSPTQLTKDFDKAVERAAGSGGIPALRPIVVGNQVVVATLANVRVLDRTTGETRVETVCDSTLEDIAEGGRNDNLLAAYVLQRGWSDGTQGTFSSDGRFVYVVEEAGLAIPAQIPGRPFVAPRKANRLAAYSVESGRMVWQIGRSDGDFESSHSDTFFLGAPLPLAGQLVCLAEVANEVRLMVFEPHEEKGRPGVRLLWSQPLVAPNVDLTRDASRRTTGLAVTCADGMFVAPTGTGVYVAIDVATRTLAWARKFDPPAPVPNPNTAATWLDDVVVADQGRAVLTPRGSSELHCVDLRTGRDVWSEPAKRGDGLFVVGVANDRLIVAGKKTLRAIRMSDGSSAWDETLDLGAVAGRGFLSSEHAIVPLASNEVAVVTLETGKLAAKLPTPAGVELGNLVPAGDRVISQTGASVSAFPLEFPPARVSSR